MDLSLLFPPIPVEYVIDTGNICNLKCKYCPTGVGRSGMKKGMMTLQTFREIINKISEHAFFFEMMNWGEPFLNKDFLKFVKIASDGGIRVNVDSNLSLRLFEESFCEKIVQSGIWKIKASIDGTNQDTYEKYRIAGFFDVAYSNLANICNARRKLDSRTPIIEWQFLVSKNNEHQIGEAKEMAASLGVNILFFPMSLWGNDDEKSHLHILEEQSLFRIDNYYFKNDMSMTSKCTYFNPKKFNKTIFQPKLPEDVPQGCSQPFNRMVISFDGTVFPCCLCYGDCFAVGNILEDSIEDIWYGEKMKACREFLINYGPKQNTKSVCEIFPCALSKKNIYSDAPA